MLARPVRLFDNPQSCDACLCSHIHRDHTVFPWLRVHPGMANKSTHPKWIVFADSFGMHVYINVE